MSATYSDFFSSGLSHVSGDISMVVEQLEYPAQEKRLRKRRSSLSLNISAQGGGGALKSPNRAVGMAYQVVAAANRSRSGSLSQPKKDDNVGRLRSGSLGTALHHIKRRSPKASLAPPMPPPKAPLPELPGFPRMPLAQRISPEQAAYITIKEMREEDSSMKEN